VRRPPTDLPFQRTSGVTMLSLKSLAFNPASLTAGSIALVVVLFALSPAVLEAIELNWLDLRFRARGPLAPGPEVVVAAIDEKSLAAEGRWPWPRSRIAALVDTLSRDGAKVIGFDVVFSDTEQDARLPLIDRIEHAVATLKIDNPRLKGVLRESREAADHDRVLARALQRSSAPVVLGYFFHMNEEGVGFRFDSADIERRFEAIAGSKYPLVYRDPQARSVPFIKAYAPQGNLGDLASAAASAGYFSVVIDPDGAIRWMPLVVQGGDDFFPPLAVLCLWHYLGKPQLAVRSGPYGIDGVQIGERFVPSDEAGRLFINFRGPVQTFPTYSVSDILAGNLPEGTLKDRIVLVGATATSLGDIRTTPFGAVFPGTEVHATVIDNILAGDFIERPRWSTIFDLSAIVALGLVLGLVLPRTSALFGLLFSGTFFLAYMLAAYWLFARARIGLNMVYPLLTVAATYTILTVYRYLSEERQRRRIKEAFRHYVPPQVVEIMLGNPAGLRLGGEEKILTALLSDMEGYTSFSERRAPNEIIAVLSDYYAEMTEEVFKVRGTLVEYVGDELFAIFGAPISQEDHAKRACDCALAMQARRNALNAEWAKIGRPHIKARIGINSGNMLVGNIGSKYRFRYGAMGDPVNLASRLEGLNKFYGTETMISAYTVDLVGGSYRLRELDRVRVKGRAQGLSVYELLGTADVVLSPEKEELLAFYQLGLAAYRERRWDEAADFFRRCLLRFPDDGPSQVMEQRCRSYLETPPPADWYGTFNAALVGGKTPEVEMDPM
jgi:adenylate cyclase